MTKPMGYGEIDPDKLRALVGRLKHMKAEMDEARGEMGNAFKNAENDLGINRMALKQAIRLEGMDPLKRADWLRSFESYCHILGIDAQAELDLGGTNEAGEASTGAALH